MKALFIAIYVSDDARLASYAKKIGRSGQFDVWEFDQLEFEEWLTYAICSRQVSGMINWPSGEQTMISINEVSGDEYHADYARMADEALMEGDDGVKVPVEISLGWVGDLRTANDAATRFGVTLRQYVSEGANGYAEATFIGKAADIGRLVQRYKRT